MFELLAAFVPAFLAVIGGLIVLLRDLASN